MREVLRIVYPGKQTVNRLTCQRIARRRGPSAGRGWGGGWKPKLRPSYSFIVVHLLLLLSFFIFSFFFFSILMASFFFMSPAAHRTWRPYYCRREFLLSPARVFVLFARMNGSPKGIIPKRGSEGLATNANGCWRVPPRHSRIRMVILFPRNIRSRARARAHRREETRVAEIIGTSTYAHCSADKGVAETNFCLVFFFFFCRGSNLFWRCWICDGKATTAAASKSNNKICQV